MGTVVAEWRKRRPAALWQPEISISSLLLKFSASAGKEKGVFRRQLSVLLRKTVTEIIELQCWFSDHRAPAIQLHDFLSYLQPSQVHPC